MSRLWFHVLFVQAILLCGGMFTHAMKIVNLIPRKGVTRPHQRDAIVSVENAWQQGITRAQVIMPGGSGKTFVGMKVIEKRLGVEDGVVVVCVPTLTLLEQTLR